MFIRETYKIFTSESKLHHTLIKCCIKFQYFIMKIIRDMFKQNWWEVNHKVKYKYLQIDSKWLGAEMYHKTKVYASYL